MNSAGTSWIALIGATPVLLILLTWSITRQRNKDIHILTRASKYIILLKTVLSLQLCVQFTIFLYSLLHKLLCIDNYTYILIFSVETLTLFKSLLSVSLVVVNSFSLNSAFIKYHVSVLFLLCGSVHVPILLSEVNDVSQIDFRPLTYYVTIHCLVLLACFFLLLKSFCKQCSKGLGGGGDDCSYNWRNKTCFSLMVICVLCSDAVFIVSTLLEKYPQFIMLNQIESFDMMITVLWAQVVEGILLVILLDPISQCKSMSKKSQIRLVDSPSSSYHLSDGRLNRKGGLNDNNFPITNGSLFASLTAVAMSRGGGAYMGGFNLKSAQDIESPENTFDKFKTYTKDVDLDLEETHSVTTIANDDFEFMGHLPIRNSTRKESNHHHQQQQQHVNNNAQINLNLYESASLSMNDLDSVQSGPQDKRLYKKNSKFKGERKTVRRFQSCESLPSATSISILDNGSYCEHYDEKVVFVTDFI